MFGRTNYRVGGTRGGQDQFKWDDVKADKYRENYLGHSLKAPVGRWQRGKDLLWYAKPEERQAAAQAEREQLRKLDEELLNEALGLKPQKKRYAENQLEASELKQLLARGGTERDIGDVERVEGLGAAPAKTHEHIPKMTLAEREMLKMEQGESLQMTTEVVASSGTVLETREEDGRDRASRKDKKEKKEKKERKEKKHKKEKKAKKEKHRHRRDRSRSDSRPRRSASSSRGRDRFRSRTRSRSRSRSRSDDRQDRSRRRRYDSDSD